MCFCAIWIFMDNFMGKCHFYGYLWIILWINGEYKNIADNPRYFSDNR